MKKFLVVLPLVMWSAFPLVAQSGYFSATAAPGVGLTEVRVSNHVFDIVSQGGSYEAETLLQELEKRFEAYNRLFRFNIAQLQGPLKVRAFADRASYDAYVTSKLGSTREGAVYLHYNQPDKRELVINRGSPDEERVLPHQAFIQFFRAFVPHPPTWMREGFAIYFNTLKFNKETRELTYEENLSWLDQVKRIIQDRREPSFDSIFLSDVTGQTPEYFHPVSWGIVSFLINFGSYSGNGDYFRSLTESFLLLSQNYTAAENAQVVLSRLTSWTTLSSMHRDYQLYIESRQTFAELIDAGQRSYAQKNLVEAETFFLAALDQKPSHFAPYYYLGLLAYESNLYDMAEQYYRSALHFGAEYALVQYAMGVNAATAGKTDEAVEYLRNAASSAPERYGEKAAQIIQKITPAAIP
jgi:tetratricopeptide (TPR) repeat protein